VLTNGGNDIDWSASPPEGLWPVYAFRLKPISLVNNNESFILQHWQHSIL